ncbi:protein CLN8 isoform X2 [Rissa tridactyla]|uniref:protein CLN8 isoform X2 n=1 Tax=Rissa tridactyla TaxID=75485 RepID=UPI0023BA44EA|nr:protein CLN8 isoform X2 [Rissa tridactyla]
MAAARLRAGVVGTAAGRASRVGWDRALPGGREGGLPGPGHSRRREGPARHRGQRCGRLRGGPWGFTFQSVLSGVGPSDRGYRPSDRSYHPAAPCLEGGHQRAKAGMEKKSSWFLVCIIAEAK